MSEAPCICCGLSREPNSRYCYICLGRDHDECERPGCGHAEDHHKDMTGPCDLCACEAHDPHGATAPGSREAR